MANKVAILNKLQRDLEQLGLAPVRTAYAVTLGNCIVRYGDNTMSSPMGGVSPATSPFLGLGAGNPGFIQIAGLLDADAAITDIFVTASDLQLLRLCSEFASDIQVIKGDTASVADPLGDYSVAGDELAWISADANLRVLGQ